MRKHASTPDTVPALNATAASLLGFLEEGPRSGYDLARDIEKSIGRFWSTSQSQIYRELARLAEDGLCCASDASGSRARRTFTITAAGRAAFSAFIARAPNEETVRLPFLLTVFFGDRLPPGRLETLLQSERARYQAAIDEYRERLPALARMRPYAAQTMRYGLQFAEHTVAWINEVLAYEKRRGSSRRRASRDLVGRDSP